MPVKRLFSILLAAAVLLLTPLRAGAVGDGFCAAYFTPDENVPLPSGVLSAGEDYNLFGTVTASSPITYIRGEIFWANASEPLQLEEVTFDPGEGALTRCSLMGYSAAQGASLSELMDLSLLSPGGYRLAVTVGTLARPEGELAASSAFTVARTAQTRLTPDKFTDYGRALSFFGGTEAFLYAYRRLDGGIRLDVDEAWEQKYIVSSPLGQVHASALPAFEAAYDLLVNTYVQVSWSGGGQAVPLLSLISHNAGAYVPRFTKANRFISHHALGTALDLNDTFSCNQNTLYNQQVIYDEVKFNLSYNGFGILPDGQRYYDFTYTGNEESAICGVPETVANYLLYELAFFRAGFGWGYYFEGTSDAMHFSLTEAGPALHETQDTGLRKVYVYFD